MTSHLKISFLHTKISPRPQKKEQSKWICLLAHQIWTKNCRPSISAAILLNPYYSQVQIKTKKSHKRKTILKKWSVSKNLATQMLSYGPRITLTYRHMAIWMKNQKITNPASFLMYLCLDLGIYGFWIKSILSWRE